MLHYFIYALVVYFLIRFIFRVVLPLLNITRVATGKVREMQQQMEAMQREQTRRNAVPKRPKEGDYIDYEEIK